MFKALLLSNNLKYLTFLICTKGWFWENEEITFSIPPTPSYLYLYTNNDNKIHNPTHIKLPTQAVTTFFFSS